MDLWRRFRGFGLLLLALSLFSEAAPAQHGTRAVGVTFEPLSRLTKHSGGDFEVGRLRGRPFIVAFGYTSCPDVCPTTLLELGNDLQAIGAGADKFNVLFVTVDPEFDTVERLRDYLTSFDPRIVGLTGDPVDIAAAAHGFNAAYSRVAKSDGSYTVDHTTRIYYFDRYGLLAGRHDLLKEPGKRRLDMMRRLLAQ